MNEWHNFKKPDALELETLLDPLVFEVTQKEATERPGSSPLDRNDTAGIYVDAVSGEPLFSSRDKYDAGCGWPSFTKPIREQVIVERTDTKLRIHRTEVRSEIADSHLGHVFTDGPSDRGGLRYCINGAALRFVPQADMEAAGYGEFLAQL